MARLRCSVLVPGDVQLTLTLDLVFRTNINDPEGSNLLYSGGVYPIFFRLGRSLELTLIALRHAVSWIQARRERSWLRGVALRQIAPRQPKGTCHPLTPNSNLSTTGAEEQRRYPRSPLHFASAPLRRTHDDTQKVVRLRGAYVALKASRVHSSNDRIERPIRHGARPLTLSCWRSLACPLLPRLRSTRKPLQPMMALPATRASSVPPAEHTRQK